MRIQEELGGGEVVGEFERKVNKICFLHSGADPGCPIRGGRART